MNAALFETVMYFKSAPEQWWRWVNNCNILELQDGRTLIYRDSLVEVMEEAMVAGLPPFTTILLMLAACRKDYPAPGTLLGERIRSIYEGKVPEKTISEAMHVLHLINDLPPVFREGPGRARLIRGLAAGNKYAVGERQSRNHLRHFKAGTMDASISFNTLVKADTLLANDLLFLAEVAQHCPDLATLLQLLQTGHAAVPQAAEIAYPDVLTALEADHKTAGLARLAKQLKAVMHFPAGPPRGNSDQFGGVSDIGNRGDLHRLLLSELAQDDHMLLARLANHETLFYKKEDMPSPPKPAKRVCIDVTLRMWGAKRIYAIAAALAWLEHEDASAWLLTGEEQLDADLTTASGVVAAMTHLSLAADCGLALLSGDKKLNGVECLYITSEENFHSIAFQAAYGAMKNPPEMLALLGNDGQVQVYRNIRKHRKLISSARFDLQEILMPKRVAALDGVDIDALPAIFREEKWPFRFPVKNVHAKTDTDCRTKGGHIRITNDGRMLWIAQGKKFAKEITDNMPVGRYFFATYPGSHLVAVVVKSGKSECYRLVIDVHTLQILENDNLGVVTEDPILRGTRFYFRGRNGFSISAFSALDRQENASSPAASANESAKPDQGKNMFWINYSLYLNYKDLTVDDRTEMNLGRRKVVFREDNAGPMLAMPNSVKPITVAVKSEKKIYYSANRKLWLKEFKWKNGAVAYADHRGFLHFDSKVDGIPQITMMTIADSCTAMWASDNTVCGDDDLFDWHEGLRKISVLDFYKQYWMPLIQTFCY